MLGKRLMKIDLNGHELNKRVLEVHPKMATPISGLNCLMGSALLFFAATLKESACTCLTMLNCFIILMI